MQLTGTNRSFGLIVLILKKRRNAALQPRLESIPSLRKDKPGFASNPIFAGLVALGKAIRPDPIPNSAVKRLSANGTLSQDTGE